jgi:hypothetical protein
MNPGFSSSDELSMAKVGLASEEASKSARKAKVVLPPLPYRYWKVMA